MKQLKSAAVALLVAATFTACSSDEDGYRAPSPLPAGTEGAYVLNQGNYSTSPDGTLDYIDFVDDVYASGCFASANLQALGSTPQDGVVHGSKLYIAVYGSDLVWVLDRNTARIVKQVPTNCPEGICAAGDYVYVTNNDGYVSRIDTTSLEVTGRIAVGPNPAQVAAANGFLYVSVSDGYNSANGYADGKRVAKISLATFSKQKDIAVGMNPGPVVADADGTVFVVTRGDYVSEAPTVWKITPSDDVLNFCEGSNIAVRGTTLYVVNNCTLYSADFSQVTRSELTFKAYDTRTGLPLTADLLPAADRPPYPIDIDVNPANGDIYIGSDPAGDYGYADYSAPGTVYRYASDGTFKGKYAAGVHPCAVIFK